MGAGGMIFVDPLFQRILVDVVRTSPSLSHSVRAGPDWSGLPVIFDEVFVGLYRLGMESTTSVLGVHPDISVNAKILTGGLVPLAVTLTTGSIFNAFYGDDKADALLHGHSYTAYPVGCEVANETLNIVSKMADSAAWADAKGQWKGADAQAANVWSFWAPEFIDALSKCDAIGEVMTLGTVLALKVAGDGQGTQMQMRLGIAQASVCANIPGLGYQSHSAQQLLESLRVAADDTTDVNEAGMTPFGINYRTLGNVAYFMLSLNTPPATIRHIENRIWKTLQPSSAKM